MNYCFGEHKIHKPMHLHKQIKYPNLKNMCLA